MEDQAPVRDVFDALALVGSSRMPTDIVAIFFAASSTTARPETPVDWAWFSRAADEAKLTTVAAVNAALSTLPDTLSHEEITATLSGLCSAISSTQLTRVFAKLEMDGPGNRTGLTDVLLELRRLTKLSNLRFLRDAIVALRVLAKLPVPKTLQLPLPTTSGGSGGGGKNFRSVVEAAQQKSKSTSSSAVATNVAELPLRRPIANVVAQASRDASSQWEPPSSSSSTIATQTGDESSSGRGARAEMSCQTDEQDEAWAAMAAAEAQATSGSGNRLLRSQVTSLANLVQSKAEELRSMQGQLASLANVPLAVTGTVPRHVAADAVARLELEQDAAHVAARIRMKEAALLRLLELERRESEITERIRRLERVSTAFDVTTPAAAVSASPTPLYSGPRSTAELGTSSGGSGGGGAVGSPATQRTKRWS